MAFLTQTISGLNTNSAGTVTAGIDIRTVSCIAWTVQAASGTHDNHKIAAEYSLDNTNWIPCSNHLTGVGVFAHDSGMAAGYIRFNVMIAEGATSTVDIILNGK